MLSQTQYAVRRATSEIIAVLGRVGWAVTSVTEWKTANGIAASIDIVYGGSDYEQELRGANVTLQFVNEPEES